MLSHSAFWFPPHSVCIRTLNHSSNWIVESGIYQKSLSNKKTNCLNFTPWTFYHFHCPWNMFSSELTSIVSLIYFIDFSFMISSFVVDSITWHESTNWNPQSKILIVPSPHYLTITQPMDNPQILWNQMVWWSPRWHLSGKLLPIPSRENN
jgi:hypothetical protein